MRPACTIPRTRPETFATNVLRAPGLVVVVIPPGGCDACHLALTMDEPLRVCAFCLDESGAREVASAHGVTEFPTVLLFREGRVVRRLIGEPLPDVLETILRTEALHAGRHT